MSLQIKIEGGELFDSETQFFFDVPSIELEIEHSLKSISKWEAKYHKPFMVDTPQKTDEELYYYMWCMIIDDQLAKGVPKMIFMSATSKQIDEILKYMKDTHTATKITQKNKKQNKEIITSELIYYWMCANYIPFTCETWPINRLLILIEICSIKNDPKQSKMKPKDVLSQNHALNLARRAASGSTG